MLFFSAKIPRIIRTTSKHGKQRNMILISFETTLRETSLDLYRQEKGEKRGGSSTSKGGEEGRE